MKLTKLAMFMWSIAFILLVGVGAAAGYAVYLTDEVKETATESHQGLDRGDKSDKRVEVINPAKDHTSVLFVGIDDSEARSEESSRSDALVLATFNRDDQSIKMVNIPRDSLTYIPAVGYEDKIAHAHVFGGIDSTVETVERMLNVPVDYYVRMNFQSFVEIVDAIGGISYDVPFAISEKNSSDVSGAIELQEGKQTLTGEEALALARTRKYDSDLARGERQMELIQQIFRETITTRGLNNVDEILTSVNENLRTNLTFEEIITFKDYFLQEQGFTFEKMQLDGEGGFTDHGWYYQVAEEDRIEISDELKAHLGIDHPIASETPSSVETKDDSQTSLESSSS